jgi:Domain of unknown function DUF29
MATQIKPPAGRLYEEDFYAWSKAQAALLRAGRFADLDLAHLIEEVDDLGEALKRSVRSRIRTIIEHLLKLEQSPARDPRGGWYDTIITQRSDLLDEITPASGAKSNPPCRISMARRDRTLRRLCARTASRWPPMRCPRPAPTASNRSPATGCREGCEYDS